MGAGSISVAVMTPDQERAAIVAWLRGQHDRNLKFHHEAGDQGSRDYHLFRAACFGGAADAIERGDHKGE